MQDRVIVSSRSAPGDGADLLVRYIQHLLDEKGIRSIHSRSGELTVAFPSEDRVRIAGLRKTEGW